MLAVLGVATASWLEVAFTLASAVGLVSYLVLAWLSAQDLWIVFSLRLNGTRLIEARRRVIAHGTVAYLQAAFVVTGALYMTLPSGRQPFYVVRTISQALLLTAEPLVVLSAIQSIYARKRLAEAIHERLQDVPD